MMIIKFRDFNIECENLTYFLAINDCEKFIELIRYFIFMLMK